MSDRELQWLLHAWRDLALERGRTIEIYRKGRGPSSARSEYLIGREEAVRRLGEHPDTGRQIPPTPGLAADDRRGT